MSEAEEKYAWLIRNTILFHGRTQFMIYILHEFKKNSKEICRRVLIRTKLTLYFVVGEDGVL